MPFRTITLSDRQTIAEAMRVNAAIDAMLSAAGSCRAHGLEAAISCACNSRADFDRLKAAYHQTASTHPDWNEPDTIVSYKNPTNGHFISLNFAALSGMIGRCEKK